jgi:hypothetical protein
MYKEHLRTPENWKFNSLPQEEDKTLTRISGCPFYY